LGAAFACGAGLACHEFGKKLGQGKRQVNSSLKKKKLIYIYIYLNFPFLKSKISLLDKFAQK
jgi:hypothetical protein